MARIDVAFRRSPSRSRRRWLVHALAPLSVVAPAVAQDAGLRDLPEPVDPQPPALEVGDDDEDRGRRWTIGVGMDAELVSPVGLFVLSAETDVGEGSGGQAASLGWGVPLPSIGRFESFALVGVRYESADLVAHEVGVDPDEARPGRPAYAPGAATVPYLEFGGEFPLGRGVNLFVSAGYSSIPNERRDSPLTDDDDSAVAFGVGVSWTF